MWLTLQSRTNLIIFVYLDHADTQAATRIVPYPGEGTARQRAQVRLPVLHPFSHHAGAHGTSYAHSLCPHRTSSLSCFHPPPHAQDHRRASFVSPLLGSVGPTTADGGPLRGIGSTGGTAASGFISASLGTLSQLSHLTALGRLAGLGGMAAPTQSMEPDISSWGAMVEVRHLHKRLQACLLGHLARQQASVPRHKLPSSPSWLSCSLLESCNLLCSTLF